MPVSRILDGIEAARAVGLDPVKVNAVIERGVNDSQILPLVRQFKGTGVAVRFIEFMDVGGAGGWVLRSRLGTAPSDLTLLAQKPKISLWRDEIRRSIAIMLGLPEASVNLKATTTEYLGFIGRDEGLMAMATVLIDDVKND